MSLSLDMSPAGVPIVTSPEIDHVRQPHIPDAPLYYRCL